MSIGHSHDHRPFCQQGPFNPEYDTSAQQPHRLLLRQDPSSNKRTPTTKNSMDNKQHQSSKHLYKKREISSGLSANFTRNLRDRRIRSSSKNRTQNSDHEMHDYSQNFGKITMHCLRKRRQIFQNEAQSLESEYTYLLKKIQKLQKDKCTSEGKARRKHLIQFNRKRELSSLQIIKASNDTLLMRRKEELKGQVISHRANKEQNVVVSREQKLRAGQQQRILESHLHEQLSCMQESRFQQNKIKCQREKAQKLRRQRRMKSEMESRRALAKDNFRHKWIDEYEKEEAAKQQYRAKKNEFERKIREAIDIYRQIQDL